ncbi:muropeptide transporter [Pigmentiphaga humi]|uniref:Muropeptide transporter n=1 Tax=Pigmentiphaga humi TaxID=2478468 RepID=A0A3P4B6V3_9BURK|nr:RhtX/FptX family siderophore transporter [Pigmentiphaga humi]VCU71398.1 muropeptide transporter [Pigmentiphaga humi]
MPTLSPASKARRDAPLLQWPMIAFLYASQGIPFGLAMEALPAILREQGANLGALAYLPLVGLPWVLKCGWAPIVDNHWSPRLGRRRSWILPMQGLVLALLLGIMAIGVAQAALPYLLALSVAASLASATQDIATDGLVAERFDTRTLGAANAVQVGGTMIGFFYGGPVFLMAYARLGQTGALLLLSLPIALSLALVAAWREPAPPSDRWTRPQQASLRRFLSSGPQAWALIAAAFLSAVTVVACHGLSKLLLVDAGWALEKIGQVGMAGGAVTIVLGCGGGAWLVSRLGAWPVFFVGIASAGAAAAVWTVLAWSSPALPAYVVWLATLLASFGAGSASVAMMTAAMRFAHARDQAGTDMTAVQSMRDLGEMAASSSLIALAALAGYGGGFMVGVGLALATLVLTPMLLWSRRTAQNTER